MPNISATFVNKSGQSRKWLVLDIGRDPNAPAILFNDYLDVDQATDPLTLYSDAFNGQAQYQRSDGSPTNIDVRDGDMIRME